MPASIWRRPRRRTAASSRSPLFVNGVISAVPTPVNGVLITISTIFGRPEGLRDNPPDLAAPPALPALRDPEDILHCEPAALALHPARGGEGTAGERRAVARGMGQRNRFRRAVEADRVRAWDEAGARRADVDRPREPGLLHRLL